MTVTEFVESSNGNWPSSWSNKLPINGLYHNIVLNDVQHDKLMWRCSDGALSKFSVKQTYYDLSNNGDEVSWSKLVWFSQNIPKFAFIFWLAIQGKLTTHDRLRKWGSYDLMVCSLCYKERDSHEHLFFKCKFSNEV